jgi:GT2 family glycosyltransferase
LERYDTLSYDQVGSFFCLSTAAVKEIVQSGALSDTPAALWGWLLSTWVFCQERTSKHLPLGLVVRKRDAAGELEQSTISSVDNIVASFLGSLGCSADSIEVLETESVVHARPRFSAKNASVQVVVPFHNKAELTVRCLKSLKQQDCLANLVISLVDNNSDQDELKRVQDAIEGLGLSSSASITSDRGYFNFARLNNRAVGQAETEFVLFLNNDVELSDAHVVSNLLSWTQLPGVDAVGGLLSYEDGRVQHGGINFSSIRPENVTGIEQYCFVAREVHAVSFAMALVRRAAYLQAGKLDEQVCPNGFGDALFCHHLKRRGSRIIYTPFASAIHRESASRGRMPEEMELYEMHRARLPIAALYDDMQATAQPTRLPLSEIEEVPLDALLSRVRRVGWLYNLGNFVAHKIIRFWPRR